MHCFFSVFDLQRWFTMLLKWELRLHCLEGSRTEIILIDNLTSLYNWGIAESE